MKRTATALLVTSVFAVLALTYGTARAERHDGHSPVLQRGAFVQPHSHPFPGPAGTVIYDPYAHRFGPPFVARPPQLVWWPGSWYWSGYGWAWTPGRWVQVFPRY